MEDEETQGDSGDGEEEAEESADEEEDVKTGHMKGNE